MFEIDADKVDLVRMECMTSSGSIPIGLFWATGAAVMLYLVLVKGASISDAVKSLVGFRTDQNYRISPMMRLGAVAAGLGLWVYLAGKCDPTLFGS